MGGLIGLLIETRTQEFVFLLIFAFLSLKILFEKNGKIAFEPIGKLILNNLLLVFGVIIVLSPQVYIWFSVYHGIIPYLGVSSSFDFLHPHLLGVITNTNTGLIYYSPIMLISFFGLFLFYKKQKLLGVAFIIFVLAEYYIIASWNAWDQASSYGIRMLITSIPVLTVGLSEIIFRYKKHFKTLIVLGLILIIFNFTMIVRFHLFVKSPTFDNGKVTRVRSLNKINSIFHTNFKFYGN